MTFYSWNETTAISLEKHYATMYLVGVQSNLSTSATFGTTESGHCGEVEVSYDRMFSLISILCAIMR